MTSGRIDYSKLMNIPGVQIFNMSDLEKVFTPYGFLRVHVSYLVNAIHIVAWYKDEVELDNGDRIPLSRQQKRKILALKRVKSDI